MASLTPIYVQNENLPIHRGKGIDGVKADVPKPAKTHQDRKALRVLSEAAKPLVSGRSKISALREKPAVSGEKIRKSTLKSIHLTDEEIKKCHEWAKEGIEQTHFTGNEQQKLQKEKEDERIRKKVDKVMSSLNQWITDQFRVQVPMNAMDSDDDTDGLKEMELLPEVLPPVYITSKAGAGDIDDLFLDPFSDDLLYTDWMMELKLKEDDDFGRWL